MSKRVLNRTGDSVLKIGDHVVHMMHPGRFTVVGVEGDLVTIESEKGLRVVVAEIGLRKVERKVNRA